MTMITFFLLTDGLPKGSGGTPPPSSRFRDGFHKNFADTFSQDTDEVWCTLIFQTVDIEYAEYDDEVGDDGC